MAECSEIEAGGEVRPVKDTTARQQIENYINEVPTKITATVPAPGIDNRVFYYKLKRKLKIQIGGFINSNNILATFQLPEGESFNVGSWGTTFPVALRNQATGTLSAGVATISKTNQTYQILVYPYIAEQPEVRALNVDITELPSN